MVAIANQCLWFSHILNKKYHNIQNKHVRISSIFLMNEIKKQDQAYHFPFAKQTLQGINGIIFWS